MRPLIALLLLGLAACNPAAGPRDYLYLWTGSADSTAPDFLAVLDVTESSAGYGRLVTTVPVPGRRNVPHHTEHELAADGLLFANGFATGQTFVFDLSSPGAPRLAGRFGELAGYHHPHSYLPLPNGNRLTTYQTRHQDGRARTGGLVEVTSRGALVRSASADYAGADSGLRVYSAAVLPAIDRVVTTTADMELDFPASRNLQVWRLSDLTLLHTFPLPDGPAGDEGLLTAEPRVMQDGRTVLVSTFSCGVYLVSGLDGDAPTATLVTSIPRKEKSYCAIPVIAGRYYLMTAPPNAVVSLDLTSPSAPREVSRLTFPADQVPHWIAVSPDLRRVVVTGYEKMESRVVIARFDSTTGALSLDERFRETGAAEPGFRMEGKTWPHGGTARGIPHGALFGRHR